MPRSTIYLIRHGRTALNAALISPCCNREHGTLITSLCSFAGALVPLLSGTLVRDIAGFPIAVALARLAALGAVIARLVYGRPFAWAAALVLAGIVLSFIGMQLDVVG